MNKPKPINNSFKTKAGFMTRRWKFEWLRIQMENERDSFISTWQDLAANIKPRRGRFFVTDNDKGDRRNGHIINSTPALAVRTAQAGMMGGITSPARPWMKLDVQTPDDQKADDVKLWLTTCTERMLSVFGKSNLYNSLPILYGDMLTFATAAMVVEEDVHDIFRTHIQPIGSYSIMTDSKGRVNTFYREFQYTVAQMITEFGMKKPGDVPGTETVNIDHPNFWDNFSPQVRNMFDTNRLEAKFTIGHIIVLNELWDPGKEGWRGKRYSSHYFERGSANVSDTAADDNFVDLFLRESGYDYFPVLCPRWETTGEDSWGTDCPAITCLGDVRALQLMERRKAQAIEYMIKPPMVGPTSMKKAKTSILPGDITYQDMRDGQQGFKPVYQIQFDIADLSLEIEKTENRINKSFFADLFLMMSQQPEMQSPMTATEVNERHEEKLLALGPVLEGMNQDVLNPLVDIVFYFMNQRGMIPPPPKQIQGMPLRIEYTSIMAEAQKLLGLSSMERFARMYGELSQIIPSVADVVNADEFLLEYGDKTSISPKITRSPDEVEQIRSQRQKAQAGIAQQQAMAQQTQNAKNLAQAPTDGDNALTDLMKKAQAGQIAPQQ